MAVQDAYVLSIGRPSSVSAMAAALCCLVQQHALDSQGVPLDPALLRQVLIDTSVPQLSMGGTLLPDSPFAVDVTQGLPLADAWWIEDPAAPLGFSATNGEMVFIP